MTAAVPIPDIAFSFLAGDEPLAARLAAQIGEDISTFVYSEHQKDLVGQNGVDVFSGIYARTAGLVVVLYRGGYGNTRWSGLERDALTTRRLDSGFDSILLVSVDGTAPDWIPASRLWLGIANLGEQKAAEAIRENFVRLKGQPRVLTFADRVGRAAEAHTAREAAETWMRSDAARHALDHDLESIRKHLSSQIAQTRATAGHEEFFYHEMRPDVWVFASPKAMFSFGVSGHTHLNISDCSIYAAQYVRPDWYSGYSLPRPTATRTFKPTKESTSETLVWLAQGNGPSVPPLTAIGLAERYLQQLL